jgi:predicted RNase H-like HicB family nuclease
MKYAVVFESSPRNFAAYVPDLPGCVAMGRTKPEVERRIREAIRMHIDGLKEGGGPIPEPSSWAEVVEV